MIGIIPIMGVGQRFKDAGITTPKHLLEVFPGITILEKIISTFNGEPVYIGCRPEYYDDIVKIVEAGQYNVHVYSLNYAVLSPIETTLMLLDHVYCDYQPIVVHYCDVFLLDGMNKPPYGNSMDYPAYFTESEREARNTFSEYWQVAIGGIYWFQNKTELLKRIKNNPTTKTMGGIVESGQHGVLPWKQIDIGTPEAYREYKNLMWHEILDPAAEEIKKNIAEFKDTLSFEEGI